MGNFSNHNIYLTKVYFEKFEGVDLPGLNPLRNSVYLTERAGSIMRYLLLKTKGFTSTGWKINVGYLPPPCSLTHLHNNIYD